MRVIDYRWAEDGTDCNSQSANRSAAFARPERDSRATSERSIRCREQLGQTLEGEARPRHRSHASLSRRDDKKPGRGARKAIRVEAEAEFRMDPEGHIDSRLFGQPDADPVSPVGW